MRHNTRYLGISIFFILGVFLTAPQEATASEKGVFKEDQRLLTTYFFFRGPWDDIPPSENPWNFAYPRENQPVAKVYGLDSPKKWPDNKIPDTTKWPPNYKQPEDFRKWLMADFRAMKWCKFDFVTMDIWDCLCFTAEGAPQPPFQVLADAWNELDRRGEKPLPMAFLLETPFECILKEKDQDVTALSKDGIEELWLPLRLYLRQFYGEGNYKPILPLRALARTEVKGESRPIIQFWFPNWVDSGIRKWDAWTFDELRRKCKETFGVTPFIGVNQHVYGSDMMGGWNGPQASGGKVDISSTAGVVDYDVGWWGSMVGPQIYGNAIVIGPGHWCLWQTKDKPNEDTGYRYHEQWKPDATRYLHDWRGVLSKPENFKRKILIVEAWNNGGEGCSICYSQPAERRSSTGEFVDRWGDSPEQYMVNTRELAPYWKKGKTPKQFR